MNTRIFEQLQQEGLVTGETLEHIRTGERDRPVSLRWELKTLMYFGVLLLTTGLGIIVYKHISSIGHLVIVSCIAVAALLCFAFCIKKAPPFTLQKTASPNLLNDYVLLLGCLLLLIFIAYIQYQYQVFGSRWGMATFVPMVILFISAYYFDHLGVLSMAIVNLAAWTGITVTPMHLLRDNDFSNNEVIFTGFALGALLILTGFLSVQRNVKAHFSFTYKNFGTHILFIAALAAIIHFDAAYALWLTPLVIIAFLQFREAVKERSFYFLVLTVLYFYAGVSYVIMRFLFRFDVSETLVYIALIYFITSGLGLAFFLIHYNKLLKKHDRL